ncbi:hypothetical protein ACRAWD_30160 [Caulobacter segnis]
MREMNRLGVTGVIDAGGGFQNYPDDYAIIEKLHAGRPADPAHQLQPVHAEAEGRAVGLPVVVGNRSSRARATTPTATTARARCWSTAPPTSRTSASNVPRCRPIWRAISSR